MRLYIGVGTCKRNIIVYTSGILQKRCTLGWRSMSIYRYTLGRCFILRALSLVGVSNDSIVVTSDSRGNNSDDRIGSVVAWGIGDGREIKMGLRLHAVPVWTDKIASTHRSLHAYGAINQSYNY